MRDPVEGAKRLFQIKTIEQEEQRKHSIEFEKLKHDNIMKELEYMAEKKINHFHRK